MAREGFVSISIKAEAPLPGAATSSATGCGSGAAAKALGCGRCPAVLRRRVPGTRQGYRDQSPRPFGSGCGPDARGTRLWQNGPSRGRVAMRMAVGPISKGPSGGKGRGGCRGGKNLKHGSSNWFVSVIWPALTTQTADVPRSEPPTRPDCATTRGFATRRDLTLV